MTKVDYSSIGLMIHESGHTGPTYEVNLSKKRLKNLGSIPGLVERRGSLSIISPVTLASTARDTAGVPKQASSFAFAYPLPGTAEAIDRGRLDLSDPAISFLALGGFVYFDGNRVCGVNALLCQGVRLRSFLDPNPIPIPISNPNPNPNGES